MGIPHRSYTAQDLDRGAGRNPTTRDAYIQITNPTELRKESEGQMIKSSAGGWGVGHVTQGRFTGSQTVHSLHPHLEHRLHRPPPTSPCLSNT